LGDGKSRWKLLLISNDAIHVQIERGGEDSNAEGIGILKANDYMWVVHDVW